MRNQKEKNKYEMTEEKYNLFFRGLCPDCKKGHLELDRTYSQMENGYDHSMSVYECCDCGEDFVEYLSDDPKIIDCVEYQEW